MKTTAKEFCRLRGTEASPYAKQLRRTYAIRSAGLVADLPLI